MTNKQLGSALRDVTRMIEKPTTPADVLRLKTEVDRMARNAFNETDEAMRDLKLYIDSLCAKQS